MDAPMCKLCEKRHYGVCSAPVTPSEPRVRKAAKGLRPTKKSTPAGFSDSLDTTDPVLLPSRKKSKSDWVEPDRIYDGRSDEVKLEARVESLEGRVLELEKRKKYMRDYQRDRRAKEKDK